MSPSHLLSYADLYRSVRTGWRWKTRPDEEAFTSLLAAAELVVPRPSIRRSDAGLCSVTGAPLTDDRGTCPQIGEPVCARQALSCAQSGSLRLLIKTANAEFCHKERLPDSRLGWIGTSNTLPLLRLSLFVKFEALSCGVLKLSDS